MDTILEDISTKKELGQFFSGNAVAKLLAQLAKCYEAKEIIDPMCGIGDMLSACLQCNKNVNSITGIEIDAGVFERALFELKNIDGAKVINRNAFSFETIKQLSPTGYDLVITNPPYIRYQTISQNKKETSSSLDISEIRQSLIKSLAFFQTIDETDRELFRILISNFSGLSDLAVPSWILCSLLTRVDGRIAMVVPHTWLNRDYALIIKYLLTRWFELEYVIEDANSVWFHPAQVKTTLLVAKRVKRKESIFRWKNESFIYATLFSKAKSSSSLVGKISPKSKNHEIDFIKLLDGIESNEMFRTKKLLIKDFAEDIGFTASNEKWFKTLEPLPIKVEHKNNGIKISSELKTWLKDAKMEFCSLKEMGVSVSQGLRTGANLFFYLDYDSNNNTIRPKKVFNIKSIPVKNTFISGVVRKQSELDDSFSLKNFNQKGIVLCLHNYALPEDVKYTESLNSSFKGKYKALPENISHYIRTAASVNSGQKSSTKLIPELSAVIPNIKKWNPTKKEEAPRFWYMLPSFTKRHSPDLFIPRVNGLSPKTRLNDGCKYLIDANFSTIWISNEKSPHNNYSLLALLNSSWSVISMEEYGTVMGGGALKLEATQINNIPFPVLEKGVIKKLSVLGKQLAENQKKKENILINIDCLILEALGFKTNLNQKLNELASIKSKLLSKRNNK